MKRNTDIQIRKSPAPDGVRGSMSQRSFMANLLFAEHLVQHVLQRSYFISSKRGDTVLQAAFVYSADLVNTSSAINLSSPTACACLAASAHPARVATPAASFCWADTNPFTKEITFIIAASLSSNGFISRNNSARSCTAVIILTCLISGCKDTKKREKCKRNRDFFSFPSESIFERSSKLQK